jgi:hypothetical protein
MFIYVCYYQKDKRAKPGNLSDIEEHSVEKYFYIFLSLRRVKQVSVPQTQVSVPQTSALLVFFIFMGINPNFRT